MHLRIVLIVVGLVLAACATTRPAKKESEAKVKTFRCEQYFVVPITVNKELTPVIVFAGYVVETGIPQFICADASRVRVLVNETQGTPVYLTGDGQDIPTVYFKDGVLTVPSEKQRKYWVEYLGRTSWEAQIPELPGRPVPKAEQSGETIRR